jgi:Sec-independent protein translocase protein TatA
VDIALVLVALIILALIWRGPRTLPQIGAMLGRGVRQARREVDAAKADGSDRDTPA